MKNKWAQRGYVELFAGPGLSQIRGTTEFVAGSARRAMGYNFTHYAFIDMDPRATRALVILDNNDSLAAAVDRQRRIGRPGNAASAFPGQVVHLVSTLPYDVAAGTRNHERLRAALWTTSR
jgi:hypothetical protein